MVQTCDGLKSFPWVLSDQTCHGTVCFAEEKESARHMLYLLVKGCPCKKIGGIDILNYRCITRYFLFQCFVDYCMIVCFEQDKFFFSPAWCHVNNVHWTLFTSRHLWYKGLRSSHWRVKLHKLYYPIKVFTGRDVNSGVWNFEPVNKFHTLIEVNHGVWFIGLYNPELHNRCLVTSLFRINFIF